MIDPQEYFLAIDDPIEREVAHIFEIYRKELLKANALDFDDLLLETVRLLKASGETRERYNRRYRYMMIDEYQDTNRPQYELMKLLAGRTPQHLRRRRRGPVASIAGVARTSSNILDFEKDFPGSEDDSPGAELSLDADDSRSCVRGGRAEHAAQGQEPVDGAGGWIVHRLLRGAGRRE